MDASKRKSLASHRLEWYVPDAVARQAYIDRLKTCGTMDEVVAEVVRPMLLGGHKRVNSSTINKRAYFEAVGEYVGSLEGGSSYHTFNRRCKDLLREMSKEEKIRATQQRLGMKVSGFLEIIPPEGERKGSIKLTVDLSPEAAGSFHLSGGVYELDGVNLTVKQPAVPGCPPPSRPASC